MKKLLLTIFIAIIAIPAIGQFNVYHPFPDSNAYWIQKGYHVCNGTNSGTIALDYWLRGDTIMHGHTYHIMAQADADQCVNYVQYPPFVYTATAACIREDSMKHVYAWVSNNHGSNVDTLLYDFNVKVGDTLPSTYLAQSTGLVFVSAIDSIKIGTSYRKQFFVKYNGWSGPAQDSIVEGMGSWNGVLGPIGPYEFGDMKLTCFKHNQDSIGGCANYVPIGINVVGKSQTQFILFPNPASKSVTISYQFSDTKNGLLCLYSTMGQLIKTQPINIDEKSITEDVSALPNGVYYYTLSVNGVLQATNKLAIIR